MWVTMLGSIPSALLIIAGAVSRYSMDSAATHVIAIFMALVTFAVIVAGAARASGLFAHWWFRDSLIHERRAAAVDRGEARRDRLALHHHLQGRAPRPECVRIPRTAGLGPHASAGLGPHLCGPWS